MITENIFTGPNIYIESVQDSVTIYVESISGRVGDQGPAGPTGPQGPAGTGAGGSWGSITGTLSAQTDLQTALNGKAGTSHTHAESDIIGLVSDLAGKAATVHTHAQSDVTGLVSALAGKEPTITSGTTAQYYRGDKSFQTLDKTAVGLGNVDNTSDANKPVSTATTTALSGKQATLVSGTNIKTVNGNTLLGSGDITISGSVAWGNVTGTLSAQTDLNSALSGKEPTITSGTTSQYYRGDKSFQTLDKTAVGLANVDNTSDANKPVSTATSTALSGKEPTISAGTTSQYWRGDKSFQTLDKTAVGLANVDNTSDANKPVSTATQTALNAKQNALTLTTTGTSGAATLVGSTLNIPQYTGGGGGGLSRSINSISTNTTGAASASTDYVYICTATLTFTLPTAVSNTNRYTVKNASGVNITVNTTSSQTMDGSTSITLTPNTALDFISDNANWQII